jgi:hypothetical protein
MVILDGLRNPLPPASSRREGRRQARRHRRTSEETASASATGAGWKTHRQPSSAVFRHAPLGAAPGEAQPDESEKAPPPGGRGPAAGRQAREG